MNPPPNKLSKATYLRRRAVVVVALVTLSACGVQAGQNVASGSIDTRSQNGDIVGSDVAETATSTTEQTATNLPPADVDIQGDDGSPTNQIIGNAVADLEDWWTEQFPKAYGSAYQPLSGGLFAIDERTDPRGVPCASSADIDALLNNAFYCPTEDAVVWDQGEFLPAIGEQFGDFTVAVVIAHEWGHAIQERAQFSESSVITELQADCFAGAWTKHVSDGESDRFSVDHRRPRRLPLGHPRPARRPGRQRRRRAGPRQRLRPRRRLPGRLPVRGDPVRRVPQRRPGPVRVPVHRAGRLRRQRQPAAVGHHRRRGHHRPGLPVARRLLDHHLPVAQRRR